jgi:hypothetical protein
MEINEPQNNDALKDSFTGGKTHQCDGSMLENVNSIKTFTIKKFVRALSILHLAKKHFRSRPSPQKSKHLYSMLPISSSGFTDDIHLATDVEPKRSK